MDHPFGGQKNCSSNRSQKMLKRVPDVNGVHHIRRCVEKGEDVKYSICCKYDITVTLGLCWKDLGWCARLRAFPGVKQHSWKFWHIVVTANCHQTVAVDLILLLIWADITQEKCAFLKLKVRRLASWDMFVLLKLRPVRVTLTWFLEVVNIDVNNISIKSSPRNSTRP